MTRLGILTVVLGLMGVIGSVFAEHGTRTFVRSLFTHKQSADCIAM